MTPEARFWNRVRKTDSCWIWFGRSLPAGYGLFKIKNKPILVHRFSYELHIGPIPIGKVIHHKCKNKFCVNPEHLELTTQTDHEDSLGGINSRKTHCPNGHPYDTNEPRRCKICLNRQKRRRRFEARIFKNYSPK